MSLEELARRVQEPKSSIHAYVAGHRFAPSQVLDRIVIALGASPAEQREWAEAWYRVGADLHTARRNDGADAVHDTVPRQLPSPVDCLVGRATQLAELDRLLSPEASGATVVISGLAGAGKTALAVYWAHSRRQHFPDGQLYVDLRGFDPDQPVQPGHALARLLRALGMANRHIARDVDERAAQYRTLLSARRMLVVLDNARDTEQARMLLPGPPSSAVVTGRDSLTGLVARHGAHRVELGPLRLDDAVRLLEALIVPTGAYDDPLSHAADLGALAEHCACLPLALRIAADLVAVRPSTGVRELVTVLETSDSPLDVLETDDGPRTSLRSGFSWSYRRLPVTAAHAFRLLGALPEVSVTPEAVAELVGTSVGDAYRILTVLSHAHLLGSDESGRYAMHSLLRSYARELALSFDSAGGALPDDGPPPGIPIPRPIVVGDALVGADTWPPGDEQVIVLDRSPAAATRGSTTG